jgi:predicted GH43/DUF377 family glycosyl hydrolase
MKIKTLMVCLLVINAAMMVVNNSTPNIGAQASLINDNPIPGIAPVPEDYQLDILSGEFAVVGVRPKAGDDFDVEVYTDTTYSTLIDSSTTSGDEVDFVALEKTTWTSPPSKGVRVTKGPTSYVIEMENEIESHTTSDTWSGSMDAFPGNPVLDIGPPGSWDDVHVAAPSILYDGTIYRMWYDGNDGSLRRIGYATSLDGNEWTKYSGNPVFGLGPSGSWDDSMATHPTVIYDGSNYHMWYAGSHAYDISIGYASSSDGITWTRYHDPVLRKGIPGSWDDIYVHTPTVLFDGATFHMWFQGHDGTNARIGYATSTNGISWTKSAANPVLDIGPSGSWEGEDLGSPFVLHDGTVYHMWYSGDDDFVARIGYATSIDGHTWTKSPVNPVLDIGPFDIGPSGSWEDYIVGPCSVLYDSQKFYMWYSGSDGTNIRIGYATTSDSDKWKKNTANPVLDLGPSGSWDDERVFTSSVLFDGITYHMWYSGYDGTNHRIGYATSPNGVTWTKSLANPVLDLGPTNSWGDKHAHHPIVIQNGALFQMWYTGDNGINARIGYATSPDGISWTKHPSNPVLDLGSLSSWDDTHVTYPMVIYNGATYQMWYSGIDGGNARIGYATSLDGITWTKYSGNPVLNLGLSGTWEDERVAEATVLFEGSTYHLWYAGDDGTNRRIGYATSFNGINWIKHGGNPVLDNGPPGSWEERRLLMPRVIYDGTSYRMWYSGQKGSNQRIGLATYSIKWTKLTSRTEVLDAYEITGIQSGSEYTIDMEVPATADLDMFIYDSTGGRNDALTSSTNNGPGIDESITFTALSSGDYLLVITNENDGTGEYTIIQNRPPVPEAGSNQTIFEGEDAEFNATGSYDPDGHIVRYDFDFGDGTSYTWDTSSAIMGKDILVFVTQDHGAYNRTYFDGELPQILTNEGFNVDISGSDQISEITSDILNNYDQLWIMSTRWAAVGGFFSQAELDAIIDFQTNRGGLLIMADHTYGGASFATDANQISTNYDVSFSGLVNHGHTEIDPFLVDHPLNENLDHIWGHWSESYITETNPDIEVIARNNGKNMIAVYDVEGEGRIVFDSSFVRAEDKEDTNHNITCAENIQYMKNIAKWLGEGFAPEPPPLVFHTYGDDGLGTDGIYTMTLTVTDDDGATAQDTCVVTVLNVDPVVTLETPTMDVEIKLRVAGSKWSNVGMTLYEDESQIGYIEVERWPGSPDDNPSYVNPSLPTSLDITKNYRAIVTYDPYPDSGDEIKGDQPNNGKDKQNNAGNPVWVILKFPDGSEERAHHTFNTQQSKKRNSGHWNHQEPWEVDLMGLLEGHTFPSYLKNLS